MEKKSFAIYLSSSHKMVKNGSDRRHVEIIIDYIEREELYLPRDNVFLTIGRT